MSKLYIGTSGFSYQHWEDNVFYPRGLPKIKQLSFYAQNFNTVEMNYPFYKLPAAKSFSNWRKQVPNSFLFAVKVSRYITHIKYLQGVKIPWKVFFTRAKNLKSKLGPFLFQLPPSYKKNLTRLKNFLEMLGQTSSGYLFAFEFRNTSWFSEDVYKMINRWAKRNPQSKVCLVDSDYGDNPVLQPLAGNFIYLRRHGSSRLYSSKYTMAEIKKMTKYIQKNLEKGLDVYVYFNNDDKGYAVENAKMLKKYF